MAKVNLRMVVSSALVAEYTNARVILLKNGTTLAVPTKYYCQLVELRPKVFNLPNIDYEFFIDRSKDILASCQYHPEYINYCRHIYSIDLSKLDVAKEIPVNEIPVEYVTIDDKYVNAHQPQDDEFDDFDYDDDEDDDDSIQYTDPDEDEIPSDQPIIQSICRYAEPTFKYKTADWKITVKLYDMDFINESPTTMTHENEFPVESSWSFRKFINKLFNRNKSQG